MQRKTRSILEELENSYSKRDVSYVVESRADNIISSVIRLMEFIEYEYADEVALNLNKRLLNAIRTRDPLKFNRGMSIIRKNGMKYED